MMMQNDAPDTIVETPEATAADPGATQVVQPDIQKTAIVVPDIGATQVVAPTVCPVCNATGPAGEIYCVDCGFLVSSAPGEGVEVVSVDDLTRFVNVQDETQVSPLHSGANSVGRENADVLLPDATVSRKHATITIDGDTITVTDLGSTNGTTINGIRIVANEPKVLNANDEVCFGRVTLRLIVAGVAPGPPMVAEVVETIPEGAYAKLTLSGTVAGVHYITTDEFRIGRREGDLVVSDSYCSGKHALIARSGDAITITDLGSTNGSSVNGTKLVLNEPMALNDGDKIVLGQTTIIFTLVDVGAGSQPRPDAGEADRARDSAPTEGEVELEECEGPTEPPPPSDEEMPD